jgi:DNA-binding CsgD family transcriptional regulator
VSKQLSPREAEVVHLVAAGKTTKEIGAQLSIAESTVNWHVGKVLTKLKASSRAEAVAISLRSGLLAGDGSPVDGPSRPEVARHAAKRADGPTGLAAMAARLARRLS